jgi:hypothetical protein
VCLLALDLLEWLCRNPVSVRLFVWCLVQNEPLLVGPNYSLEPNLLEGESENAGRQP